MIRGLFGLVSVALWIALTIGWVLNIITIVNTEDILNGMGLARVVGIFVAPLGGVLGYF